MQGWPDNPKAWLVTVASRRLTDQLRSNAARRRREEAEAARTPPPLDGADSGDAGSPPARDDTLTLLFLCCHPALSPASQVALTAEATDWPQILALYALLERVAPNPMATLNRAVALAMVQGPAAGLAVLDTLSTDDRIAASHHLLSVRAHLLEMAGDHDAARAGYREAARRTTSEPERRHLLTRTARLG